MSPSPPASGFLNIAKPQGMTSREVVNQIQRITGIKKVGHAGTLDPMASGVLVVGIGRATRLIQFVQRQPKTYQTEILLGRTSDTDDIWGVVQEEVDPPVEPTRGQLDHAVSEQVGQLQQVPPRVSAVKIGGRRAYKMARNGESVLLSPRPVIVHRISVVDYRYPLLSAEVVCGSGTYIRAIARDLGQSLHVGAVMSCLRRTAIGPFDLGTAISLEALQKNTISQVLIPAEGAFPQTPKVNLNDDQAKNLSVGKPIILPEVDRQTREVIALDRDRRFVAWLARKDDGQQCEFRSVVNWAAAQTAGTNGY